MAVVHPLRAPPPSTLALLMTLQIQSPWLGAAWLHVRGWVGDIWVMLLGFRVFSKRDFHAKLGAWLQKKVREMVILTQMIDCDILDHIRFNNCLFTIRRLLSSI